MIEVIVICIIFAILNFFAFVLGLHYGSKVKNNEPIEMPKLNPVKIVKENIRENKESKVKEKEQLIEEINLYNIDNYDGTGLGQREFPN